MKPTQVNFWRRQIVVSPNLIAVLICSLQGLREPINTGPIHDNLTNLYLLLCLT